MSERSLINIVRDIRIEDFNYPLPDDRIARHPLAQRDACKLIVSNGRGEISHHIFSALPALLPHDALLVCNDTRVINARVSFVKSTGAAIEVFLLEPCAPNDYVLMFQAQGVCRWKCLVGNLKRWKEGALSKKFIVEGREVTLYAENIGPLDGNAREIEFRWSPAELTFASIIDKAGYIPIPPYLKRDSESSDFDDYQTVYSKIKGSVAAPTAGLHFTDRVLDDLKNKGVELHRLTLHVGAGTFQPVKSDTIGDHPMHTETFTVDRRLVEALLRALREKRQIVAVGTTTVRTLESLPYLGRAIACGDRSMNVRQWWPYGEFPYGEFDTKDALEALLNYFDEMNCNILTASTSIMIAPGFNWRIVDRMVTNFHQPQSTLLLLVSSFLDRDSIIANSAQLQWKEIYREALSGGYRFLSYGDACLLQPKNI